MKKKKKIPYSELRKFVPIGSIPFKNKKKYSRKEKYKKEESNDSLEGN